MKWYLRNAGRVTGPWDEAVLRERIARGEANSMDEVSEDGAKWVRVRSTPLWAPLPVPEPPPVADHVSPSGLRLCVPESAGGFHGENAGNAAGETVAGLPQWEKRSIGFTEAWKRGWTRWSWAGRASLPEYWWRALSSLLEIIILSFGTGMVVGAFGLSAEAAAIGTLLSLNVYSLVTWWPNLCLMVRRLHDSGKSGWFFWVSCIPLVGGILLLVFLLQGSNKGKNKYGEESVIWAKR